MKGVIHTMKFTCNKNDFSNGIGIVLKAVPGKSTMPILECVVIEAVGSNIKLTTNDMQLGIETTIEGNVMEEGTILVNAKMIAEIVRKLPENEVLFQVDENLNILLKCGKSKFNLSGKSSEEFPRLLQIEKEKEIIISQFALKEMVRQTIFSISDNESNRILTGELFEINGDEFRISSLDLHRVSIRKIQLKKSYEPMKAVIPGKTLNEISKILGGNAEDEVKIYFTSNHVMFEFDQTTVLSCLIEGNYYNINQMLSNDYETKIKINKMDLLGCIDRGTLLLREAEKKPIIMTITDGNTKMEMNTKIGSMDEDIGTEKEGSDIKIAFNPKFLIDVLRVIDEEEIYLYMTNAKAPCFIKDNDGAYIYLILPVNLNYNN